MSVSRHCFASRDVAGPTDVDPGQAHRSSFTSAHIGVEEKQRIVKGPLRDAGPLFMMDGGRRRTSSDSQGEASEDPRGLVNHWQTYDMGYHGARTRPRKHQCSSLSSLSDFPHHRYPIMHARLILLRCITLSSLFGLCQGCNITHKQGVELLPTEVVEFHIFTSTRSIPSDIASLIRTFV